MKLASEEEYAPLGEQSWRKESPVSNMLSPCSICFGYACLVCARSEWSGDEQRREIF